MNINQNVNRPQLKKIKRPINRTAPIVDNREFTRTSTMSQGLTSGIQGQDQRVQASDINTDYVKQSQNISTSKELNEYLDDSVTLPDIKEKNNYIPNFIEEEQYEPYVDSEVPSWLNLKVFIVALSTVLIVGLFIGKLVFSQSTVVRNGLQGVVVNSEVPRGRARCGIAERSQGCVLYIMNPQRQEMAAKDFYDLAAQMTGRQKFMIETGNMRYANSKIKPGDIVQLNIPPL